MKLVIMFILLNFSLDCLGFSVLIDAGHGGFDNGAVYRGVKEAKLTLATALKLKTILEQKTDFKVYLSRNKNKTVNLTSRAKIARNKKIDVTISLHANSSPARRARGVEFYVKNQLKPDDEAYFLAHREQNLGKLKREQNWPLTKYPELVKSRGTTQTIIQDLYRNYCLENSALLAKFLVSNWHGKKKNKKYIIKQAPFYMLNNTNSPSVLVEMGFITNSKELKLLTSNGYQNKIANSIYKGLVQYKDSLDKTPY